LVALPAAGRSTRSATPTPAPALAGLARWVRVTHFARTTLAARTAGGTGAEVVVARVGLDVVEDVVGIDRFGARLVGA